MSGEESVRCTRITMSFSPSINLTVSSYPLWVGSQTLTVKQAAKA
jgi:hypothetical protein